MAREEITLVLQRLAKIKSLCENGNLLTTTEVSELLGREFPVSDLSRSSNFKWGDYNFARLNNQDSWQIRHSRATDLLNQETEESPAKPIPGKSTSPWASEKKKDQEKVPTQPGSVIFNPVSFNPAKTNENLSLADEESLFKQANSLLDQKNYQEALEFYEKAINIKPDYYPALSGKGEALYGLGRYQEALEFYEKAININPDYYPALSGKGAALCGLGRYQEALDVIDISLTIRMDRYFEWVNRSTCAYILINCVNSARLILPEEMYNFELDLRGYQGEIGTLKQGIICCKDSPYDRAMLYFSLAEAYENHGKEYITACQAYEISLAVITPETYPEMHLKVLRSYIRCLLRLGQNEEAKRLNLQGSRVLAGLIENAPPEVKNRLQLKFRSFAQYEINEFILEKKYWNALQKAEEEKNLCISWFFNHNIPEPKNYKNIFNDLLSPNKAIIYWHYSPAFLTTFILKHRQEPFVTIQYSQAIETWLNEWKNLYNNYSNSDDRKIEIEHQTTIVTDWQQNLETKLKELGQILKISTLTTKLSNEITQLILIPHRELHCLPLHFFFADRIATYLPSAVASPTVDTQNKFHLSLIAKAEDIPLAEGELSFISSYFPGGNTLTNSNTSKDAVLGELSNATSIHYAGHSQYNQSNPAQSALIWSETDSITALDLYHLEKSTKWDLVFLNGCESGLTGSEALTTEYVGLPGVFLKNAKNVISTLWVVNDLAAYLVSRKFYELVKSHSAPQALYQATKWLRCLDPSELNGIIKTDYGRITNDKVKKAFLRQAWDYRADKPFSDPFYWAAFICLGS